MTLQLFDDRQARTWVVVEPVAAAGPEDPTIPVTRLVEGNVAALGFCDDAATEAAGPARIRSAWWLGPGPDGFEVRWLGGLSPYGDPPPPAIRRRSCTGPREISAVS